ncbi:monovalent cation/H(+) antiporter subunit G [Fulvivirga ulvae]|uniref:monovalent cation/H(+) antiporter subunit G n=1 Tax=Fulvivirga ulvae TaxID=2904245 RepID=UPI001F2F8EB1|nr:monovalent cation/H(+) antiporter subunit G [Fulvivirga ulvae]UII30589.1 monovalent cation/H(+) antiporter subunit G [Fulvivirga ulvae]
MIKEWIAIVLLALGALFILLASVGLIRLPDIYTRMHATTKAPTLGIMLMLTGLCIYFPSFPTVIKSLLILIFIFLTIPVASHMIGRSAHMMNTKKWKSTSRDDLEKSRKKPQ